MTLGRSFGLLDLSRIVVVLTSGGWRQINACNAPRTTWRAMCPFTSATIGPLNPKSGVGPEKGAGWACRPGLTTNQLAATLKEMLNVKKNTKIIQCYNHQDSHSSLSNSILKVAM